MITSLIAIDPGKKGGFVVRTENRIIPERFTTFQDTARFIQEHIETLNIKLAVLEEVHSMPSDGRASAFSFGTNYGFYQGVLNCCPNILNIILVSPQVWQGYLNCFSGGDKRITKRRAEAVFPFLPRITHNIADALLISEYAWRVYNGTTSGSRLELLPTLN